MTNRKSVIRPEHSCILTIMALICSLFGLSVYKQQQFGPLQEKKAIFQKDGQTYIFVTLRVEIPSRITEATLC